MNRYWNQILKYSLYAGILISPFIWWPNYVVSFEVPRGIFLTAWSFLCLLLFLIRIKNIKILNLNRSILLPLLVWIVWALLTSVLGTNITKSFAGNYYRFDGLIVLFSFCGLALIIAMSRLSADTLMRCVAGSSILVTLGSLMTLFCARIGLNTAKFMWGDDIGFTFGNPHYLAGFLVVTAPAIMTLLRQSPKRQRLFWAVCLLLNQIVIMLTRAYLSLAVLVLLWIWRWTISNKRRLWFGILVTLISIAMFLIWVFHPVTDFEAESRARIWHRISMSITQRPLIGFGWANVDLAIKTAVWPFPVLSDVYVDKAHSEVMEIVATTGVIGLMFYGWLLFSVVQQLSKVRNNQGWLLIMIAYLLQSQVNVISTGTSLLFWLTIGIGLTVNA